ncbi:hypothetical protein NE237_032046 [Protea cynaroides]|uniref:Uncharacterized protein n=1 Tax=Protea cynaroides TaxID=273540 RepID=A0A9Q0R312_9MAGN|nr:hypothetical protein NE237_032046 [Protea cynaroides]
MVLHNDPFPVLQPSLPLDNVTAPSIDIPAAKESPPVVPFPEASTEVSFDDVSQLPTEILLDEGSLVVSPTAAPTGVFFDVVPQLSTEIPLDECSPVVHSPLALFSISSGHPTSLHMPASCVLVAIDSRPAPVSPLQRPCAPSPATPLLTTIIPPP